MLQQVLCPVELMMLPVIRQDCCLMKVLFQCVTPSLSLLCSNPVVNYTANACGTTHILIGDGGNAGSVRRFPNCCQHVLAAGLVTTLSVSFAYSCTLVLHLRAAVAVETVAAAAAAACQLLNVLSFVHATRPLCPGRVLLTFLLYVLLTFSAQVSDGYVDGDHNGTCPGADPTPPGIDPGADTTYNSIILGYPVSQMGESESEGFGRCPLPLQPVESQGLRCRDIMAAIQAPAFGQASLDLNSQTRRCWCDIDSKPARKDLDVTGCLLILVLHWQTLGYCNASATIPGLPWCPSTQPAYSAYRYESCPSRSFSAQLHRIGMHLHPAAAMPCRALPHDWRLTAAAASVHVA